MVEPIARAGLLLTIAATSAAAQGLTDRQRASIDSVFAPFGGTNRPGCALGVGRNGTPVYLSGYGMADLQSGLAIMPSSIFHVASVSKQFAAFAVALLARDGLLSLDDEVRTHVPELPDYGKRITIRHLIHHTSGIRDQWELLGLAGWRYPDDIFTQDDVLEIVRRQRALNFDPGDEYLYSNSGYTLLAIIAQRVSGKSLREFSDERIFQPLGMSSTHVHDDHTMIVPGRTSAYQRRPDSTWRISVPAFDTHGATSLFTTVGDLLKWQHHVGAATVGGEVLVREAETSSRLNNGKETNYGFGLTLEDYRGTRATGHGGADAGYRADVVRFPEHGLAIAVLCNFAEATPGRYARAVADVLLAEKLGLRAEPMAGAVSSSKDAANAAGIYRRPGTDLARRFEQRGDTLFAGNFDAAVAPLGPRRFAAFGLVAEFGGPEGKPAEWVRLLQRGATVDSLVRVARWSPTMPTLGAIAGDYWSDELGVGYRLAVKDSALWLHRPKRGDTRLTALFEDAFSAPGTGTIRVVRARGSAIGFRVTGGRVRNVAFDRRGPRPVSDSGARRSGLTRAGPAR
jgi:CubicO group peptidase (beta-lactamase class C family)